MDPIYKEERTAWAQSFSGHKGEKEQKAGEMVLSRPCAKKKKRVGPPPALFLIIDTNMWITTGWK
jgi:hypothetical protein